MPGRMPGIAPCEDLYAGDQWGPRVWTFTQGGAPLNLVTYGCTQWSAQWRPTPDTSVAINLAVDDSNAATGVIVVSATGAQTEQMGGPGGYDLQSIMADGEPFTWLTGTFTWTQDYSR